MDGTIQQAIGGWGDLYGGELQTLPITVPEVEAIAVRCTNFRRDPGNWPKIFHHRRPTDRVLVLIHGLKDSPGYLEAIALRFAAHGVNVVLPLLPAHGRRNPLPEMRRASYRTWQSTVDRTVQVSTMLGDELSIGGLSTGGTLAIDKCLRDPAAVGGKVFLFAAALGLAPAARLVLATSILPGLFDARMARRGDTGLSGNPIKYSTGFLSAARQVHLLIKNVRRRAGAGLERLVSPHGGTGATHHGRIFVAHSENDRTIPVGSVKALIDPEDPGQHHLVPLALAVNHAELVLAETMTYPKRWPSEPGPPRANPQFEPMIEKALAFLER